MKVLSNIVETDLEDHQLYKFLAFKLEHLGFTEEAINVYEKITKVHLKFPSSLTFAQMRGEEPQSFRDYAVVLSTKNSKECLQSAAEHLVKVIEGKWDLRFDQIGILHSTHSFSI
jgi:hypothetical protein